MSYSPTLGGVWKLGSRLETGVAPGHHPSPSPTPFFLIHLTGLLQTHRRDHTPDGGMALEHREEGLEQLWQACVNW